MAVAAFFDIDGTLLAKNSGPLYMRYLRRRGQIRRRDVLRTLYFYARYRLNMLDIDAALERSSGWIRGKSEEAVAEHCRQWYEQTVRQYVQPELVRRLEEHKAQGHLVAILSSTTNYLARPLAADLGIEHLLVSRLVVEDGRFTGKAEQPLCYGDGKIHWARRFAEAHDVDFAESYFYTDSASDLPMLEIVGHPQVVNPDIVLGREARRRGWPVLRLRIDRPVGQNS